VKRTYYLRSETKQGQKRGDPVACLMSEIDRTAGTIKYALSIGHPKDNFFKSRGRMIAAARLTERPRVLHMNVPTCGHDISRIIMADMVDNMNVVNRYSKEYIERLHANDWFYHIPSRVIVSAGRWLQQAALPKPIVSAQPNTVLNAQTVEHAFTNPKQQEAWDFFQSELTNMLANKYFNGKWVLVVGREIINTFDSFENAFNHAVPKYMSDGANNFIIQQVVKEKPILITRMLGV
jgi:hypothetical protein